MKVFKVMYETTIKDEITDVCEFVVADDLNQVAGYFTEFCNQYEHDLKLVQEGLTVVRDIREERVKCEQP